jgi:hypothetical protein
MTKQAVYRCTTMKSHAEPKDRLYEVEQPSRPKNEYLTIQSKVFFVSSIQLSVSGNDFNVESSNGDVYLRTEGKAFDLKSKIDFFDTSGEIVLHLEKEVLVPRTRWIGTRPSGEVLFKIERQLSCKGAITPCSLMRP